MKPIPISIYSSLVDRILKLATTGVAVNLSYGGDFSLCVALIATHFNVPLIVVLSLRDRFETSRSTQGINMEQILINLITGALGGAAVGKSLPSADRSSHEALAPISAGHCRRVHN